VYCGIVLHISRCGVYCNVYRPIYGSDRCLCIALRYNATHSHTYIYIGLTGACVLPCTTMPHTATHKGIPLRHTAPHCHTLPKIDTNLSPCCRAIHMHLCIYVPVYLCIYVSMYFCIFVCMFQYGDLSSPPSAFTHTHAHTSTRTRACARAHTRTHTHAHRRTHRFRH